MHNSASASICREHPQGVEITVKAVAGSSRTEIAGLHGQMLKIKVAAPPEKGKANKAIIELLAKKLNLKKSDIQIQSGQTSSIKQIFFQGIRLHDMEVLFNEKT